MRWTSAPGGSCAPAAARRCVAISSVAGGRGLGRRMLAARPKRKVAAHWQNFLPAPSAMKTGGVLQVKFLGGESPL